MYLLFSMYLEEGQFAKKTAHKMQKRVQNRKDLLEPTKKSSFTKYFNKYNMLCQVGSRRVVQWAAALMVLQGVIGKLGAVFILIPQPIVGGLFCVMFGMISAFGESYIIK